MITKLDLDNLAIATKILDLQLASYRVEADIVGFDEIPPLKDTITDIQRCGEVFYGYFADWILAGIISYKIIGNTLDIHRVAVHPCFFREGIAQKLLSFIEKDNKCIDKIIVSTGRDNTPAVALYLKNGYKKIKDIEAKEGFYVSLFQKQIL